MKKKLFKINQIKRYFNKRYLIIKKTKKDEESNIGSIARTLLASLLIISFFSISPIIIDFTKSSSFINAEFENNSKNDLKKLLEKKR